VRGAVPPLPQYAFMAWCSVKKKEHRDNFTFTFTVPCSQTLSLCSSLNVGDQVPQQYKTEGNSVKHLHDVNSSQFVLHRYYMSLLST